MTAREGGFLASRILGVYLGLQGLMIVPVAMNVLDARLELGAERASMFGILTPWAYMAVGIGFLLGAALLWYKAALFADILSRSYSPGQAKPERTTNWQAVTMRLLGLYLILDHMTPLLTAISWMLEDSRDRTTRAWNDTSLLTLYSHLGIVLIGVYLLFFQGGIYRAANYMFNYDQPAQGDRDE